MTGFMQLALLMPLLTMPTLAASEAVTEETPLDALQNMFPKSSPDVLQVAAKWLEESYGAGTADDLKGVSNWAVEANSAATADESLSPDVKRILSRFFLNQPDEKPQEPVEQKVAAPRALNADGMAEQSILYALQRMFPEMRADVLQSATKWLEHNFGATTAEDLDGVSHWGANGMALAADDKNLSEDAKHILQAFFQGASMDQKRRLALSSSSTTTSSSSMPASTTTTATTPGPETTATTTTTTTGPETTTTTEPATTTTTTTGLATTVTTTSASSGRTYSTKVVLAVEDTAWVNSPNAKDIMTAAIVASNADITTNDQVNIISLTAARRLHQFGRRLAAGNVECVFDVTFPASYTGPGLTVASIDKSVMTDKLQNNDQGVSIAVTSIDVQVPTCTSGCPGTTTMKVTTTKGAELSGAVTAQQLATSIAGIVLMTFLSGF